jgi:hypothetical protein
MMLGLLAGFPPPAWLRAPAGLIAEVMLHSAPGARRGPRAGFGRWRLDRVVSVRFTPLRSALCAGRRNPRTFGIKISFLTEGHGSPRAGSSSQRPGRTRTPL